MNESWARRMEITIAANHNNQPVGATFTSQWNGVPFAGQGGEKSKSWSV